MSSKQNAVYTKPALGPPPSFRDAKNRRQRTRASGLSPNYWYPMEWADAIAPGEVKEVTFWKRSIAIFRTETGDYHAIENRCCHRQLKLSEGQVYGCNLRCQYHGWAFDGDGKVVDFPHEMFGKNPKFKVDSFPLQLRHGLIWIFPGDPALAETVAMPEMPELEGPEPWHCVPVDFVWDAHHSMILDNVSDYTHAWLHRRSPPFSDARLLGHETIGDTVHLSYATTIGAGKLMGQFIDRKEVGSNSIKLVYDYPYHRSNTDDVIKHLVCSIPIDERTTRVFFILYYKTLKVPFIKTDFPRWLMKPVIKLGNRFIVGPVLAEDAEALRLEQEAWEAHWDQPIAELNPIVKEFQDLTIRMWREYLESVEAPKRAARAVKAVKTVKPVKTVKAVKAPSSKATTPKATA